MITSWKEMKVKHLIQIRDIDKTRNSEDEKNLMVGALLAGMKYDDFIQLPLSKTRTYMEKAQFIRTTKPEKVKARKHYKINGKKYRLDTKIEDLTVAQYIDFQALDPDSFDERIAELLAVFLIPEGHKYNDGYDIQETVEDIWEMSVGEALGVADFFIQRYIKSMKHLLMYLRGKMIWTRMRAKKEDKERMRALELEINLMTEEMEALLDGWAL